MDATFGMKRTMHGKSYGAHASDAMVAEKFFSAESLVEKHENDVRTNQVVSSFDRNVLE